MMSLRSQKINIDENFCSLSRSKKLKSVKEQDEFIDAGPELSEVGVGRSEPLLRENPNRYVMFPIRYKEIWKHYKTAVACFWTPEEIDFTRDAADWESLTDQERFFIKNILAFFAGSDGIVMENLAQRFMSEIQLPEALAFYSYQMFIESVHSETYSLLIDTYVKDPNEKTRLFEAINTIPCVGEKAQWAIKWIQNKDADFGVRLVAFAIVEGIFFSGSFCAIFWLAQRNKLPGLTFSNKLISRDEGQHTDFAVLLHSMLVNKPSQDTVHDIVKEAVEIEKSFITKSLPCHLIGMNSDLMGEYIEFVADRLLSQMSYDKIWNTKNPFDFMELISLRPKGNFFEVKVSEYMKAGVGKSAEDNSFALSDDF
jgi:ribonucleotide reductase beta subunit family protein with ferritin-like domain